VGDWNGPANLSLTTPQATNAMAAPQAMNGFQLWLQTAATLTYPAATYQAPEAKVSLDLGTAFAMDLGGIQGKAGIVRTGGRPVAKGMLSAYPDISAGATAQDVNWAARTPLQMHLRAFQGAGATRRSCGVILPTALTVGKPDASEGIDKSELYSFELDAALSSLTTAPTTDVAYSPVVIYLC